MSAPDPAALMWQALARYRASEEYRYCISVETFARGKADDASLGKRLDAAFEAGWNARGENDDDV